MTGDRRQLCRVPDFITLALRGYGKTFLRKYGKDPVTEFLLCPQDEKSESRCPESHILRPFPSDLQCKDKEHGTSVGCCDIFVVYKESLSLMTLSGRHSESPTVFRGRF